MTQPYGPLASADERYLEAFCPPQPRRPGFWCRLGLHSWRIEDQSGPDGDRLNVWACSRCGRERP